MMMSSTFLILSTKLTPLGKQIHYNVKVDYLQCDLDFYEDGLELERCRLEHNPEHSEGWNLASERIPAHEEGVRVTEEAMAARELGAS